MRKKRERKGKHTLTRESSLNPNKRQRREPLKGTFIPLSDFPKSSKAQVRRQLADENYLSRYCGNRKGFYIKEIS